MKNMESYQMRLVLYLGKKFFESFRTCETVEDIKQKRILYLKTKNEDYQDLNWQYYYYLMRLLLPDKGFKNFFFDFEECYDDGDRNKQTTLDDYDIDCFNAHMPPDLHVKKGGPFLRIK